MKLWIPGAAGLLGSALCRASPGALATGREVNIGNEAAVRAVLEQHPDITHIVNCAAFSLVDAAETQKEEAFAANALGPENLAKVAQEKKIPFIHISTDYVFAGEAHIPLKENDPVGPLNYYGLTKLEGEQRVQQVNPDACILRTSWIFGDGGKNFVAKLLHMFRTQEEVRLTDDQWGRPTYALDLVGAILQMFGKAGVYHFANAGPTTKFAFGCAMRDLAEKQGLQLAVKRVIAVPGSMFPSPCKRPSYSAFDTSKIESLLKSPIRPWQEALSQFLCNCS